MGVEFEIDGGVDQRKKTLQRGIAAQPVGSFHAGEGAAACMFGLRNPNTTPGMTVPALCGVPPPP
jgi:hypothetical protein